MSDFYTPPSDIPAASRAKSSQIKALKDSVVSGFDAVEAEFDSIEATITSAESSAAAAALSASAAADSETAAGDSEQASAQSASDAEDSKNEAATIAAGVLATSTTSLAIEVASKTFTTQAGKQFATGQFVLASSAADSGKYMHGHVVSYSGTSLVVDVTNTGGIGTAADWNISISGSRGTEGAPGPGDRTLLDTKIASNASSIVFEDYIDGTYDTYIIECLDLSGSDGTIDLRFGTGATPTYVATGYSQAGGELNSATTATNYHVGANIGSVALVYASGNASLTIRIVNPSNSLRTMIFYEGAFIDNTGQMYYYWGTAGLNSTTPVTAAKLFDVGATTTYSGTFKLYGV